MRTWRDIPELCDAGVFRRVLAEEGSFDRVARRLSDGFSCFFKFFLSNFLPNKNCNPHR